MRRPASSSVPFRDLFPSIKAEIRKSWQFCWDLQVHNKMKEITQVTQPWVYPFLPRRKEVILCRLRIGHTRLTHGFLMSGDPQSYCEDCLVPLTVKHILTECPSLRDERSRHLSECRNREGDFLLVKILGEGCSVDKLFGFIEEAGLLNLI